MKFEERCAESIQLYGNPFEEVHRWLDDFAVSLDCPTCPKIALKQ